MTAVLLTPPYLQFFDDEGAPLAGGKVYSYTATGTFSTPKATFTTQEGNVEHPNPVILDGAGRPTTGNGSIWLSGTYDFKVTDADEATIETTLSVTAFTTLPSSSNAYFQTFSGTGSQTAFTTSSDLGADEKAIYVWVDSGLQQAVTNGAFATDTGWTKGTGWTIGAGVATATGAISTALSQTAAITIVASEAYVLTYTVTRSAGGIIPSIGGTAGVERTAAGTYTEVISAGTSQTLAFTGNAFTGTLDNISITVANPKGYDIQNPSAYTISGTTLTFSTAPATGTNNIYVSAPSLLVGAASSAAADAAASAAEALESATAAASYSGQLIIVSTTSLAIGTGSKVFTVLADLALNAGQFILIRSDADATNYMWGQISSYSGTTLTINVTATGGSGTLADWTMYLTGERGATGATGSISDLTGVSTASIATGDYVIFQDISASNVTKKDTIANVLALATPSGLVLLQTQTASSSPTIDFTSIYITSTYKEYILDYINVVPQNDDVQTYIRFSQAASFLSGGSDYTYSCAQVVVATQSGAGTTTDRIQIGSNGVGNASGESTSGRIILCDPTQSGVNKTILISSGHTLADGTLQKTEAIGKLVVNTSAIDGIRFLFSSGNITSGIFKLYGVV